MLLGHAVELLKGGTSFPAHASGPDSSTAVRPSTDLAPLPSGRNLPGRGPIAPGEVRRQQSDRDQAGRLQPGVVGEGDRAEADGGRERGDEDRAAGLQEAPLALRPGLPRKLAVAVDDVDP